MVSSKVFEISSDRGTLILAPSRNISSLSEDDVQLQWDDILGQLDNTGIIHVVFDFEKVNYFGSSMLEAMLYLWKRINPAGGKMAVCNVSETAAEILKLSKFDTIWPICDTLNDALESVNG